MASVAAWDILGAAALWWPKLVVVWAITTVLLIVCLLQPMVVRKTLIELKKK